MSPGILRCSRSTLAVQNCYICNALTNLLSEDMNQT